MARRKKTRGIFCLEGDWWGDLKRPSSVRPILDLLSKIDPYPPYIHRGIGTREEFNYYLYKWTQRQHDDYPILYLAFHGNPQTIHVGDKRRNESQVTLDDIADMIAGRCRDRIVHFGACSTMQCDKRHLTRFLRKTGA